MNVVTPTEVAEQARVQKLAPVEGDFIGKKGYERKYNPDGSYKWRYSYTPNEGGKQTRESHEVWEMMKPFVAADTERVHKKRHGIERATLKDKDGRVRLVRAAQADACARQNGWTHAWRAGGASVASGPQGMLFRRAPEGWEPLGVRCLGTPLRGNREVPCRGVQFDPSGMPWRGLGDHWVRMD